MLTDVVIANKSYTKFHAPKDCTLDSIALKVIRQDCPDFLLPIKAMEIDGETEIRYELLDGVRLSYMPKEMCKKDFTEMLANMLIPFKICNDWFLDYHNFMLDENYILIGKNGQSVKYIYLPAEKYSNSDEAVKDFFTGIILKTDIRDDVSYMVNLLRIIKNPDSNLLTLLDYVQQESRPNPANSQPAFQDRFRSVSPKQNLEERKIQAIESDNVPLNVSRPGQDAGEFGKHDEEGRLIGNLFGESDEPVREKASKKKKEKPQKEKTQKEKMQKSGNGIFGIFKGKPKEEKKPEAPVPRESSYTPDYRQNQGMPPVDFGDATTIVNRDEINDNRVLRLRLENCIGCDCPEFIEIDLQNGFATVGRVNKNGETQSDFNFDAAVSFVSRRHFRVEKREDHWQVIDLESTNGTHVNGEALIPNVPHPLLRSDVVTISCNKRHLTYRVY